MTKSSAARSQPKKKPTKKKPVTAKPAAKAPAPQASSEMNERQKLFCLEYIIDFNATQAAIRAGYSEKTAGQIGYELLKKPEIQAEIATQIEKRTKRTKIDADWVLERLTKEVYADLADLYDDDGNLKPVREWPIEWRTGLVAGLETEELKIIEPDEEDDVDEEQEPQGHGGSLKRSRKKKKEGPVLAARVRKVKFSDRKARIELIGKHVDVQAFKDRKEHTVDEPLQQLLQQIGGQAIRPASEAAS